MSTTELSELIEVSAAVDHLTTVATASAQRAIAELIWNSVDSDASKVWVGLTRNELGNVDEVVVSDNGHGMHHKMALEAFGSVGGSWKRKSIVSQGERRLLHGRHGKGRLAAFSLGHRVSWYSTTLTNDGLYSFSTSGEYASLKSIRVTRPEKNDSGSVGVVVRIEGLTDKAQQQVLAIDRLVDWLSAEFAGYMRSYPHVEIFFDGIRLDPKRVEERNVEYELQPVIMEDGKAIPAKVRIVEWKAKGERRLCLCDAGGFTVSTVDTGIRPGSEFSYTAYLCCDYFRVLEYRGALDLQALDSRASGLIEEARSAMRSYFRARRASRASDLVEEWKRQGIYPYKVDAKDSIEEAQRQVFDICALTVAEFLESFRRGDEANKQFVLEILRVAVQDNPPALKSVLTKVLKLPAERIDELSDLLDKSPLEDLISSGTLITERLDFLAGLHALLFEPESQKHLLERSQLHKILENETWIFGEEYNLSFSDESLTTILRSELKLLRDSNDPDDNPVALRDDGSDGIIDLLLAREVPQNYSGKREFLVVELKRPSKKIDLKVKGQIESYGLAVASHPCFDKANTRWTFIAISNDINESAARTISQPGLPVGFFHDNDNVRIGLASWASVIQQCRTRYELFRNRLNYQATREEGVQLLRKRYEKYLPDCFLPDDESD